MEVAGEIGIFENQKACAPLRKYLFGAKRFAQWWFVACLIPIVFIANWAVERLLPGWGSLGILAGSVASWVLWLRYTRTLGPKAWMARGVPSSSPTTYRIEDGGLVLDSPNSMIRVAWSGMSQIAPGNQSWLFIGSGQAWFLPTRFFPDRQQERAFLTACFDKLTPQAQARSGEVAALVA